MNSDSPFPAPLFKITPVTEIPESTVPETRGRPSTISAKLVDDFISTGAKLCAIEGADASRVRPTLSHYIKTHRLPIRLIASNGILYMQRTDIHS